MHMGMSICGVDPQIKCRDRGILNVLGMVYRARGDGGRSRDESRRAFLERATILNGPRSPFRRGTTADATRRGQ